MYQSDPLVTLLSRVMEGGGGPQPAFEHYTRTQKRLADCSDERHKIYSPVSALIGYARFLVTGDRKLQREIDSGCREEYLKLERNFPSSS